MTSKREEVATEGWHSWWGGFECQDSSWQLVEWPLCDLGVTGPCVRLDHEEAFCLLQRQCSRAGVYPGMVCSASDVGSWRAAFLGTAGW